MALSDWKLAEHLNVYQIALLSAGYDPSEYENCRYDDWPRDTREGTAGYLTTVKHAARTERLEFDEVKAEYGDGIDWENSLIEVESYRRWLKSRNHTDAFFNCAESVIDDLLFPFGHYYAPKLAAAVEAWRQVTNDPAALKNKTPKKALEIWLRQHAHEYDLTDKDGKPNELGIEEVSKVANWKPKGGVSPTPSVAEKPTYPIAAKGRKMPQKDTTPSTTPNWDDEIPF